MRRTPFKEVKPILDKVRAKTPITREEAEKLQHSDYSMLCIDGPGMGTLRELTVEEVVRDYGSKTT